jgi:ornithine cyclodeaminase/alanine dehydrogenase-like protein (mu-crystallin family)
VTSTRSRQQLLYLSAENVREICKDVDSVALIRDVLYQHGSGHTILPDEAYLLWRTARKETVRSLSMPAYVGGTFNAAGTKIINSNVRNSARGLPRASGLTVLFDSSTGEVISIMEGAHISAMRTASVTFLSVGLLTGRPIRDMAVIGAGVIGATHIELGLKRLPSLERVILFDINQSRADELARQLQVSVRKIIRIEVVDSALKAIKDADVIVPATTVTDGYIPYEWLKPGAIVVNVSLDDLLPDAILNADLLFVDDWNLVRADSRRLLGRMYREGIVLGPKEHPHAGRVRKVDGELGDLVLARHPGRNSIEDIIVVNPFGLGIEDVAFAARVFEIAKAKGIGMYLSP